MGKEVWFLRIWELPIPDFNPTIVIIPHGTDHVRAYDPEHRRSSAPKWTRGQATKTKRFRSVSMIVREPTLIL